MLRGPVTISLFPFLSILACVIGVLTLMITALASATAAFYSLSTNLVSTARRSLAVPCEARHCPAVAKRQL